MCTRFKQPPTYKVVKLRPMDKRVVRASTVGKAPKVVKIKISKKSLTTLERQEGRYKRDLFRGWSPNLISDAVLMVMIALGWQ